MADLVFVGQFVASKVGATGLTVTVDIDRYTLADGSRTALVTAGGATEGRRGLYHYRLAGADLALYQYVATFITASATVDQQEIAAVGLLVLTEQQTRDAMMLAPTAGAPAAGSVDAHLDDILEDTGTTLPGLIAGVGAGSGTGYYSDTLESPSGTPVDGARVMLATDEDGLNVAYEARSDAFGVFEMRPDPGTYYRFIEAAGHTFTQGAEVLVEEA